MGRVVVRSDCDSSGGGACSFVVIDLFIAAMAACLCGWLIRSARHGTADNDDGHGHDATRMRVCWRRVLGVFGGRPLGRAQSVRS
jgi:hypothetical protein